MKLLKLFVAASTLLFCTAQFVVATPAAAQSEASSSIEDKQRFVSVVRNLEQSPLNPNLRAERSWAIQWLIKAPDISVKACLTPLDGVTKDRFAHSSELVVQYMLGMAAFIIENPDKVSDIDGQQLAGVESALRAYQSMRAVRAELTSPAMERQLARQKAGELPQFSQQALKECLAQDGG